MRLGVAVSGRWSYATLNPYPGKQRGRGQEMACQRSVALSDHVARFGQAIPRVRTINMCASRDAVPQRTTDSGLDATHNRQGILSPSLSRGNKERRG